MNDGRQQEVRKEAGQSLSSLMARDYQISADQMSKVGVTIKEASGMDMFVSAVLPILLPMVLPEYLFFMVRSMAGANSKAMSFGQSQAKEFNLDKKEKVTFQDVAGAKEAKEELKEVVEF